MKKWTEETIRAEAKKYNTRGEFYKGNAAAYNAAIRLHLLDQLLPRCKWTRERVAEEIAKYSTYNEFRNKGYLAYCAMENKGWHELATHLPKLVHRKWNDGT